MSAGCPVCVALLEQARDEVEGSPCDPDRSWAWRDCGDGAERDLDDDGPIDTDESYAIAMARNPALVTPIFTAFRPGAGAHSSDERR